MRIITVLLCLAIGALAAPNPVVQDAAACDAKKCLAPDCRCSGTSPPPDIESSKMPQFVFLTFDDAVTVANHKIYTDLFYGKKNPDGCDIGVTYFMSHEYSDYSMVHDLYVHNHEIALHSISHSPYTEYWRDISLDDMRHEFGDEKILISHFANLPEDALQGMRVPFLQLAGENTYTVAKDLNLTYDCSWPTQTFRKPGMWPYTLDYKSRQDCPIGPCPKNSIPGVWVAPMIDWVDQKNIVCSMVDACVNIPINKTDETLDWFIDNFNVQYKGNKAPFGFYVHAAWFGVDPNHLPAYSKFVDYLLTLPDVYIITPTRAIDWIKNPVPIGSADWPKCAQVEDRGCVAQTCKLSHDGEDRYMTLCGDCPEVYPWLKNPLGKAKDDNVVS